MIKITKDFVLPLIPKRIPNSHKGSYGTALCVCGSKNMPGAAILTAKAAYRTGVGIVKSVLPKSVYPAFVPAVPEAVLEDFAEFKAKSQSSASACLIGCGMGNTKSTKHTVLDVLKNFNRPIVIDADGINSIASDISIIKRFSANAIITPHPKEASRILNVSVQQIQSDREKYVKQLANLSGSVALLKGANTLICSPEGNMYILENDNSGLATAGSGDVLSGIIVALCSLGLNTENAAVVGAYIHAEAGSLAAKRLSQTSMCAGDIIDSIAEMFCNIS